MARKALTSNTHNYNITVFYYLTRYLRHPIPLPNHHIPSSLLSSSLSLALSLATDSPSLSYIAVKNVPQGGLELIALQ
jgi:hypothetical protein